MNRKAIAIGIIILIVVGGVLITGGLVGDYLSREFLGVGLLDLLSTIFESGQTLEGAQSFDTITAEMIGNDTYNTLLSQKTTLTNTFGEIKSQVEEVINSNAELTNSIKQNLGESYSVYIFSIYTHEELTFKVFEWSIGFTNGNITTFDEGKTFENYNVIIQISHTIASDVLEGRADTETITRWVTEKLIKINPITEVTKVINILPAIINAIPKE